MLKTIIWTIRKRGLIVFFISIYYFLKILLFRFLNQKYIKKKIYNFEMLLDVYDKGLSRTLLLFGQREIEQKFIIEKIIKPDYKILDLGSNIGYYALIFKNKILSNNIILVEPSPSNFKLLKKNLELNNYNNVEAHLAAISNTDSAKEFYLSDMSNLNSFHIENKDIEKYKKIIVKSYSLPTLLKDRKIDLIRMDVEGHEVSIFKSLIEYINKYGYKPSILFEPHISKYNEDNDMNEQLIKLFNFGYCLRVAASSSHEGKKIFTEKKYKSIKSFKTDEKVRDIFLNISNNDALKMLAKDGGVRTALLSCENEHLKFIK